MPTYEYACGKCGEHLEVVQSFRDDPLERCPSCGGRLRKVFSPVGIVFKGSGFYKTDSRDTKKAKAGASSSEKSSSDSDASSASTDSGPASTSDKSDGKSAKKEGSKETSTKAADKPAKTSAAAS